MVLFYLSLQGAASVRVHIWDIGAGNAPLFRTGRHTLDILG
jgi:hypothetical protein